VDSGRPARGIQFTTSREERHLPGGRGRERETGATDSHRCGGERDDLDAGRQDAVVFGSVNGLAVAAGSRHLDSVLGRQSRRE
jgi:hypothetical protein